MPSTFRRRRVMLVLVASAVLGLTLLHFFGPAGSLTDPFSTKSNIINTGSRRPLHLHMPTEPQLIHVPPSTWTCTDTEEEERIDAALAQRVPVPLDQQTREELQAEKESIVRRRQCVVKNLCVDTNGAFIRASRFFHSQDLPLINMISADPSGDAFWTPRVHTIWTSSDQMNAHYVDETLFIHGLYAPHHFSHHLYNNIIPVQSTIKRFNGTANSWFLRAGKSDFYDPRRQSHWNMQALFNVEDGRSTTWNRVHPARELVLDKNEVVSDFQVLPPLDAPICFRSAVVGLGSQCAHGYCERNVPTKIYDEFKDKVRDAFWSTRQKWVDVVKKTHGEFHQQRRERLQGGDQQEKSKEEPLFYETLAADKGMVRHVPLTAEQKVSNEGSPLNCLWNTRYFNFESHHPEGVLAEAPGNIGVADPDGTLGQPKHKKRLVVALIQRESSRTVLNLDTLAQALVAKGFRVKSMTFDHGCGLAATAYLLRDVDFLVTPHGNAIGTSIFMPRQAHVTVLSVDNTLHDEPWFMWPTSAVGQRFLQHAHGPHYQKLDPTLYPLVRNMDTALYILGYTGLKIERGQNRDRSWQDVDLKDPKDELLVLTGDDADAIDRIYEKYGPENVRRFVGDYWKEAPRYLNVDWVVRLAEQIELDRERDQGKSYLEMCRENRCCGRYCDAIYGKTSVFLRNLVGDQAAHGMVTEPSSLWGMYQGSDGAVRSHKTAEDKAKEFIPGEQLKSWKPEL